jgi:hypothetical protein
MIEADEFRKWLMTYPWLHLVGRARDPVGDPLANFLSEHFHRRAMTGRTDARRGTEVLKLPAWARDFQRRIDQHPADEAISAGHALQLLAATVRQLEQPPRSGVEPALSRSSIGR